MASTLEHYWRGLVLWRKQEKLKKERERLDQEVRKRQEEAVKLGITHMLLDVYKNGYSYQPWITNYQSDSPKNNVNFSLKGKSYIIKWEEATNPFDEQTTVTISLHDSERELFRDRFEEDCDEFGIAYDIEKYGYGIAAYISGEWVKDFRSALDAVAERETENASKAKHSQSALDDLKSKFGL